MGNNNSNTNVNHNIGQLTYPLSSFKQIKSFDIQKSSYQINDYVIPGDVLISGIIYNKEKAVLYCMAN